MDLYSSTKYKYVTVFASSHRNGTGTVPVAAVRIKSVGRARVLNIRSSLHSGIFGLVQRKSVLMCVQPVATLDFDRPLLLPQFLYMVLL
jgi:hypothetical protein